MSNITGQMSDYAEERKQFACLIAYELGARSGTDSLYAMAKCIEYANNHKFELEKDSNGLIDTERARISAAEYAQKIDEETREKFSRVR